MTTECPFCLIVAGDAPARVVYADDHSIAFLPLNPATPGHTLVVPKEHVEDFFALSEASALPLGNAVSKVARAVRSAVSADGMNLITSSGVAAQQTVFHLHIHVLPRMEGDAVGDIWPPDRPMAASEADALRARISGAVDESDG